jgi:hypothetical protein
MIYFVPEATAAYEALGIRGQDGYFASRAAPMGAVSAGTVTATFYNFHPRLVGAAIPAAWDIASPAALLEARLAAADAALRRLLGDEVGTPEVARAAELARAVAERAADHPQGRPLFAGHAGLEWPEVPHLVLWHAQSCLREFRGDGHVAALLTAGIGPVDALVAHAASRELPEAFLRATRGWGDDDWEAAVERLRRRGWLEDGPDPVLGPEGMAARQRVEDETDQLAVAPYGAIGEEGCAELRALVRPLSRAIVAAGAFGVSDAG